MHCFKDTHITAPISLAKTCYKVTPITRDLESSVTPKAWEKWGYLIDNDHGSHHLPFFSQDILCLYLHAEYTQSFPH